ncbi:MAG TPA: hypothetical protein VEO54_29665 [Thermoanaerobaculia bacterium]|nr:hypothetical protein [Thermoanaerobaculia bacterium]
MSSFEVRLEVTAADAATELYVIDGDFNLVDRGIGSKVFQVTPGIYKIKARSGIQQEERLVIVRGDEKVEFAPLPFASAVPLENTAGTMRREGTPFDPYDTEARLEEIARQAIGHGRKVLSSKLRARIAAENASPMLGILGMHLLIREGKRNKEAREQNPAEAIPEVNNIEEVRRVIANLRATIGRHPDVETIAIGAGVGDPTYAFDIPPMLTVSWRLLLKATALQPELIPRGSLGEQVAMRLWGDGAWLQWLDPATDRIDREAAWQANAKRMLIYLEAADEGVFQAQRLRLRLNASARRKLVKQLGIPMAAIDAWIEGVEKKP